jgi:hypothetical protein
VEQRKRNPLYRKLGHIPNMPGYGRNRLLGEPSSFTLNLLNRRSDLLVAQIGVDGGLNPDGWRGGSDEP